MSALSDAAQAVAEARREVHEFLWPLAAPDADRARAAIARLEAAVRHHDAEQAAAEMAGCCDECDAAIDVMRAAIHPKEAP